MANKQKANEPLLFCQVIQNCAGVKRPQFSGQKVKYQNYRVNDRVSGYDVNASDIPTSFIPAVKTKDGYVINKSNLMVLGEEQEAEIIDQKDFSLPQKINALHKKYSNAGGVKGMIDTEKKKSEYMVKGGVAGGVVFAVYALMKGKAKMPYFIVGAIIGGFFGKLLSGISNDEY